MRYDAVYPVLAWEAARFRGPGTRAWRRPAVDGPDVSRAGRAVMVGVALKWLTNILSQEIRE